MSKPTDLVVAMAHEYHETGCIPVGRSLRELGAWIVTHAPIVEAAMAQADATKEDMPFGTPEFDAWLKATDTTNEAARLAREGSGER